ncbi:MAG: hypothetical protein ACTHOG_00660 [Marmoricola sp.]
MIKVRTKLFAGGLSLAVSLSALMLAAPQPAGASVSSRPTGHVAPLKHGKKLLAKPMRGKAAITALGSNVGAAAAINGRSIKDLKAVLTDPTMWLEPDGHLFVRDQWGAAPTATATPSLQIGKSFVAANTFLLHSHPGSQHTIYLDFVGASIANDLWTNQSGVVAGHYAPWSLDSSTSFSTTEEQDIQEIWSRVAADYASFDVDVTTQAPTEDALVRTTPADQTYGIRVLFSGGYFGDAAGYAKGSAAETAICGGQCGGVASIGNIAQFTDAANGIPAGEFFGPAWVFTDSLGPNVAKWMADAAAHEAGHTFGLTHQGTTTDTNCTGQSVGCSYYDGYVPSPQLENAPTTPWLWGPIMGDPYQAAVTQWARGEYPSANNGQDEMSLIAGSAPALVPSSGTSLASAVALPAAGQSGYISGASDQEYYALGNCSGTVTLTGTPAATGPNLDVKLELLDSAGNVVSTSDPVDGLTSGSNQIEPVATGLDASLSAPVTAGTYYLRVSGGGSYADGASGATDSSSGFSNYASIGTYVLSGANGCAAPASAPSKPTQVQIKPGCNGEVLSWKAPVSAGNSPLTKYEVSLDNTGIWRSVGTSTTAYFSGIDTGSHTYWVRADNGVGPGPASSVSPSGAISGTTVSYLGYSAQDGVDVYEVDWNTPASTGNLPDPYYYVAGPNFTAVGTAIEVGVTPNSHPTLSVTPHNAAGIGPATSVAMQAGATPVTGSAPTPAAYTGTVTTYCPAPPSAPRSVKLVRGAIGGSLTTVGSWVKPAVAAPAINSYQVKIWTRNRSGKIVATKYVTTTHLSLAISGSSAYTYRIIVRAHNAKGYGAWSAASLWVAPR